MKVEIKNESLECKNLGKISGKSVYLDSGNEVKVDLSNEEFEALRRVDGIIMKTQVRRVTD